MSLDLSSRPANDPRLAPGLLHSNEIIIGLALGSPGETASPSVRCEYFENHHTPSPLQQATPKLDHPDDASQPSQGSPTPQPIRTFIPTSGLKRSGSKWKNLGGLLGKKTPLAPSFDGRPFYMLDQVNERDGEHPGQLGPALDQASGQKESRGASLSLEPQAQATCSAEPMRQSGAKAILRRASTRRIGIRKRARAQTGGSLESSRGSPARARLDDRSSPEGPMKSSTDIKIDDHQNPETSDEVNLLSGRQRLLEVDIPSVELDRYSVMFGDLFNRRSGKPPAIRPSRRQSQLRERQPAPRGKENNPNGPMLMPLSSNPPLAAPPPRPPHTRKDSSSSTGSKSSTSSAKYGLFPPTGPLQKRSTSRKPVPKPSPLSRSVTVPNANTANFHRPTISTSKSQAPDEVTIVIQKAESSSPQNLESSQSPSQAPHHRRTSSFNPSDLSNNSFPPDQFEYEDQSDEEAADSVRPLSATGARTERPLSRSFFPVRKSSMRNLRPSSRATTSPVTPTEALPTTPSSAPKTPQSIPDEGEVAVAVARQVSISRRQRTVVPIAPQGSKRQSMQRPSVENSCSSASSSHFPQRNHSLMAFEDVVEGY